MTENGMANMEGSSFQTHNSMTHFSVSQYHRTLELQGILRLFLSKNPSDGLYSQYSHQALVTQPLLKHFQRQGTQHLQIHFVFWVGKGVGAASKGRKRRFRSCAV